MKARGIALTPDEQADLELVMRRPTSTARDVLRAGVILDAATGASNQQIAEMCIRDRQKDHKPRSLAQHVA